MKSLLGLLVSSTLVLSCTMPAMAASVSEREYKRGFDDCSRGDYDQNQHGSSYKRGCRAAEDGLKKASRTPDRRTVDQGHMEAVCHGAVTARFSHQTRTIRVSNVEHQNFGWGVYGTAVLDDGSTADFVCMFSSNGKFKRVNASEPIGAVTEYDHEGYCPPDVSEADRYRFPACN